jgi:hypothetical protein
LVLLAASLRGMGAAIWEFIHNADRYAWRVVQAFAGA